MAISKIVGYITPGMTSGEKTLQKLIPDLKNAYDWVKVVLPDKFSGANISASFYITDNIYILCNAFNNSGNTAEMKTYFVTEMVIRCIMLYGYLQRQLKDLQCL